MYGEFGKNIGGQFIQRAGPNVLNSTTSFDYVFNEIIGIENGIVEIYVQPETLARFLKAAQRKNFGNGEYVFIYLLPFGVFPYQFEKELDDPEIADMLPFL